MSKLTRIFQRQFGLNGVATDFGVFGSLATGSPVTSKDPIDIQNSAAFMIGWTAETIATNRPALEDFNGLDLLTFRQIAYLLQEGVAEWDVETPYYVGSIVNDGTGVLYKALINSTGIAVTNATAWGTVVQDFVPTPANALVGSVVQEGYDDVGTVIDCSTELPYDNTTPLITEGNEVLKVTITPKSATNKLLIQAGIQGAPSAANVITTATIWLGTQLVGVQSNQSASTSSAQLVIQPFEVVAGTTSPIDITVRVGCESTYHYYVNGAGNGGAKFNGAKQTSLTVQEIKV